MPREGQTAVAGRLNNPTMLQAVVVVILAGLGAMTTNLLALWIFVQRTDALREEDLRHVETTRLEYCEASNETFGLFTEALVSAFREANGDRTPQEQAVFDQLAEDFRADVDNKLPDCSPTDGAADE